MKTVYNFAKVVAVALAMISAVSCADVLTTGDPTKIDGSSLCGSTSGLEQLLTSAYKEFIMDDGDDQTGSAFQGCVGYGMIFDCAGSDIVCFENYGGSPEEIYKFLSSRTQASGGSRRLWCKCYNIINQTNIILDHVDAANGSEAEKAAVKGQALAMRAWSYFYLIMNYQQTYSIAKNKRGVILRLHEDDPASMEFSTVEQVYAQIVSDLTTAKTALASFSRGSELWKVDKIVVSGMLARVYQVMENWSACLAEATTAYNAFPTLMGKAQWYSGFDTLYEDGCPELIWGVPFTNVNNISSNTPFNFWYNGDPSVGEGMNSSVYNFTNMMVTQSYVDLFKNDPADYRGVKCDIAGVTNDADELNVMFWHRKREEVTTQWAYNKLKSYGTYHDYESSNGAIGAKNYDISFPLMRSSEMLLIMAEAAEHVTAGSGAAHLNKLRVARGANAATTDILEEIYRERRRELLGEGVTGSYDLLRLKKDLVRKLGPNSSEHFQYGVTNLDKVDASTYTLKSNDYRFICQIPELEIANNDAIDESIQNPFSGQ